MNSQGIFERSGDMSRLNILKLSHIGFAGTALRTHEGAPAVEISAEAQLRRSVLACLLWENQFYEDGVTSPGASLSSCPRWRPRRLPRSPSRRASR